jgi:hypothetical protein
VRRTNASRDVSVSDAAQPLVEIALRLRIRRAATRPLDDAVLEVDFDGNAVQSQCVHQFHPVIANDVKREHLLCRDERFLILFE